MNAIYDKIRFAKTQRNSFIAIAKVKEGEIAGVDCRPEMSAQDCLEIAEKWDCELRQLLDEQVQS